MKNIEGCINTYDWTQIENGAVSVLWEVRELLCEYRATPEFNEVCFLFHHSDVSPLLGGLLFLC